MESDGPDSERPTAAGADLLVALDEVVDAIVEVKQANWLSSSQAALYAELSSLMVFLVDLKDDMAQDERQLGGDARNLRAPSARPRPPLPAGAALADKICVDIRWLADHLETHASSAHRSIRDSLRTAAAELRRRADSIAAAVK